MPRTRKSVAGFEYLKYRFLHKTTGKKRVRTWDALDHYILGDSGNGNTRRSDFQVCQLLVYLLFFLGVDFEGQVRQPFDEVLVNIQKAVPGLRAG